MKLNEVRWSFLIVETLNLPLREVYRTKMVGAVRFELTTF